MLDTTIALLTNNVANDLFRLEGIVREYRQALKSSESEKEKLRLEIKSLQVSVRDLCEDRDSIYFPTANPSNS